MQGGSRCNSYETLCGTLRNGFRRETRLPWKQLYTTKEETKKEKIMNIYAAYHPDYFTLLPSISFGSGWFVIDWLFNCIEFQWNTLP